MNRPVIVWFRQDLRVADNPALSAAAARPVLPVFVLDDAAMNGIAYGGAARWWLHHSLVALGADLGGLGARLHVLRGDAVTLLADIARDVDAEEVQAGWLVEPWAREQERALTERLSAEGRRLVLHASTHVLHPTTIAAGSGNPYTVYSPFAKKVLERGDLPEPLPAPERLNGIAPPSPGLPVEALDLLPKRPTPNWAAEFTTAWKPGEAGGQERLARFARPALLREYSTRRNDPAVEGSSGLSPHLRWGEVSPRQVWHAAREAGGEDATPFLKEIIWREFSHHLLWHRPEIPHRALRPQFEGFPFRPDRDLLRAWEKGRTGYPIVDAGMRQLWRIGWMHNRVRMIAASLLVKHLLQPWQDGAAWFMDTLVDADPGNNSASWQWMAGSGTDAAPYFRVFNPITQGEKFDPEGGYVRRWVPELARLPSRYIHRPYEAPAEILRAAGVSEAVYPRPIVDHAEGRARALSALRAVAKGSPEVAEGAETDDGTPAADAPAFAGTPVAAKKTPAKKTPVKGRAARA
ncbi:cryptochrome/photolyase family protein [Roseomonas sp. CCTCC AB2023176]|uniref:cryptochrome/photolyase family protein n=1 Tax=Roseomonas sp. CCTCC AB2023176 TaxID=3342640 RepID=UPI0035DCBD46